MTDRQHRFLSRLMQERDISSLSELQREFLAKIPHSLTVDQASRIISTLLRLPKIHALSKMEMVCSQMAALPGETWEDIFYHPSSSSSVQVTRPSAARSVFGRR